MIRKILLFLIIVTSLYFLIDVDSTEPVIKVDKGIIGIDFNNTIEIKDNLSKIENITMYLKYNNKWVQFFNKNYKKRVVKIKLNETSLNKLISKTTTKIELKIISQDGSLHKNKKEEIFNFNIDNIYPSIKIKSKTLNFIKKDDLIVVQAYINDKNLKKDSISLKNNIFLKKERKNNIYDFFIPVTDKIIKDKKITIKTQDMAGNIIEKSTYFLTKEITQEVKKVNEKMLLKYKETNELLKDIYKQNQDIYQEKNDFNKNILNNKIISGKYNIGIKYNSLFNEKIKNNGVFIETKNSLKVYSPMNGYVVFKGDLGFIKNAVVIKHFKNCYSIYGNLNNIKIKIKDKITSKTILGLTNKNSVLIDNQFYFAFYFGKDYLNPSIYKQIQ